MVKQEEELLETCTTLAVSDTIEYAFRLLSVQHISSYRVSSIGNVSRVPPPFPVIELTGEVELVERYLELLTSIETQEVSKGLIQPQVIPPLHSHQITKPHVTQFMGY